MLFLLFLATFLLLWLVFWAALPTLWRLLSKLAHRGAALSMRSKRLQRHADYWPVALILGIGIVLTMFIGDEFLDIAELVHAQSPVLQQVDRDVHAWAAARRNPSSTLFFEILTTIGAPWCLGLIVAAVAVVLVARRRYRWAIYLIVTALGGGLLDLELKAFYARARPDLAEALRSAHGYSFPSGHSMGAAVVFGALSYLAFRASHRWRWKTAVLALGTTLSAAIALSRVYLGVHWVSDIGAGLIAGALWVVATTVAYETVRRIRMIRSLRRSASSRA